MKAKQTSASAITTKKKVESTIVARTTDTYYTRHIRVLEVKYLK